MAIAQTDEPTAQKPLRLWPGVAIVVLQWLVWFVVPFIARDASMVAVLGGLAGGLAVVVWWLFFSRAPWAERVGAVVLMVVAVVAAKRVVHQSIANGMMGMLLPVYAIPALSLALVAWAAASRRLSSGSRRASMIGAILLACGVFTLLRTGGITGDADSDFHWRWSQTPEERLVAQASDEPTTPTSAAAAAETPEKRVPDPPGNAPTAGSATHEGAETDSGWPGFRGPKRDGIIRGVRIETDWSRQPPVAQWRRPIGPGWSSFAVRGNLLYTQEQRGDNEVVSCYNLTTGEPVWRHRNAARFWESNAGAGPRATPTLSGGRVYTFGATGIVNALDARNGSVVWSRNAASDTQTKVPSWGFASSPLVVGDVVIVAAAGVLAAYDVVTGDPRWVGPTGGSGYSSPHLSTIDGVAQVLLLNGEGVISVAPADGKLLWNHAWPGDSIVQPAVTTDGDVLIGSGSGLGSEVGMRRVAVAHGPGGWTAEERWTSIGLKPYFNDFVVHKDHAFGFDGSILACIDLKDGTRKWKGGRYGHGQIVLLPDQDLLMVVSEEGALALVKAAPDQFTELARFQAIEGKTWNHPVLVGDLLLVRNGEEMVAFRMSLASR
ncbi:MAG: PQQ-like beta-propeller repeat protein [Acidobacteria bacterium]|nr:PQQ-like beta-propeller repeat protein [Acidobacteriota bacterium]